MSQEVLGEGRYGMGQEVKPVYQEGSGRGEGGMIWCLKKEVLGGEGGGDGVCGRRW